MKATNHWDRPISKLLALLVSEHRDHLARRASEVLEVGAVPKEKESMKCLRKHNNSFRNDSEMIEKELCGHLQVVYALATKYGLDLKEIFEIVLTNDPCDCGFPMATTNPDHDHCRH